jgi:hypothetical protein
VPLVVLQVVPPAMPLAPLALVALVVPLVVALVVPLVVALVAPLVVLRVVPLDLDLSAVIHRVKLPEPVPSAEVLLAPQPPSLAPLPPVLPIRVLLGLGFLAAAPLVLAVPDLVRLAQASLAA